jgi:anti-sigma regulatory factor (Ser/Thr protein kinase)
MNPRTFHHEAFIYAGIDEFVARAVPFLDHAREAGEPALVMTDEAKLTRLRAEMGPDRGAVEFADIREVGRNPARIIPAWAAFVEAHDNGPLWGIGEPVWPGRSPAELDECRHHEALVNQSFAHCDEFTLLCPYDAAMLGPDALDTAHDTHPLVADDEGTRPTPRYQGVVGRALLAEPLPPPPARSREVLFDSTPLGSLRRHVEEVAVAAGLDQLAIRDIVLAVDEVATNSQRHGSGGGVVASWLDGELLVFEVRDDGHLTDPLVGRRRPPSRQVGGRGLWIVNQLCDLVQIRSSGKGTVVRLFKRR